MGSEPQRSRAGAPAARTAWGVSAGGGEAGRALPMGSAPFLQAPSTARREAEAAGAPCGQDTLARLALRGPCSGPPATVANKSHLGKEPSQNPNQRASTQSPAQPSPPHGSLHTGHTGLGSFPGNPGVGAAPQGPCRACLYGGHRAAPGGTPRAPDTRLHAPSPASRHGAWGRCLIRSGAELCWSPGVAGRGPRQTPHRGVGAPAAQPLSEFGGGGGLDVSGCGPRRSSRSHPTSTGIISTAPGPVPTGHPRLLQDPQATVTCPLLV